MSLASAAGVSASARALAAAMSPLKTADAQDLLRKDHLPGLQFHLQPDQALFDVLQAHTDEARKNGRTPFHFVDLTAKDTLPLWVPSDGVGGKFSLREEEELSLASNSPIGNLGDLTRVLKSATSTTRFFRSVPQWTAAFWRWAVAAISAQHITLAQVLAHQDVVLSICEQERLRSRPPYAGFLYDEMARRQWARRAEKKDPSFDLTAETQKVDKDLKEVVMQRLGTVLRLAELEYDAVATASGSRAGEQQLSQQLAAAAAAQRKADAVTKSLASAQKDILAKAAAAAAKPNESDETGEKQLTNKQRKAKNWFLKQKERREQQWNKKQKSDCVLTLAMSLTDLQTRQLKLVAIGNELALFSLKVCQCQVKSGKFFSIENPELSWLWILLPMIQLRRSQGVSTVRVLFSDFQVPFRKPTVFVHNSECLHELAKSESSWHGRTVKLRGLAKYDGKLQFRTRLAQSYPPLLCIKFAGLVRETVVNMRERGDWDGWASGVDALSFQLPDCLRIAEAEVVVNCCGDWMFVPHGLGAMKGLSPLEHVAFSLSASHPSESRKQLEETLKDAIEFECGHEVGEIDEFRCFRLNQFLRLHASLQQEHLEWVRQVPTELQGHAAKIHGPLWKVVLQQCGIPCERFLHDLQFGFPLVGHLAPCEGESVACQFEAAVTVDELVNSRGDINERVIASVRELPFSSDILSQALQDSAQGFMSTPRAFTPHDASHLSLTRRIPVREERSKGWRTRVVDHSTESMVNAATVPCDRIKHHTLDDLADMVMCFFESNCQVSLWKVDISQAFRRVPIKSEHMQFAWTVWMHLGCLLVAQHTGMPFGTVSAVYAWHRVGFMLCHVVRVLFLCPAARYVDDFFGASRRGVRWNAGRVLAVICKLLGFPVDDDKSAEDDIRLVILGAECEVDWLEAASPIQGGYGQGVSCALALPRRKQRSIGDASKLAGRLSFAVTVPGNRVGPLLHAMNGQEQALCNQVWLAQNWVHETVRAFTRRFGDQLARQLRTAEALQVSALILHRSGAGVVLQSEEVWQMLPREWEARRLVLLKKWRNICQQDTKTAKGHGAKPFGSYKPAAFLQKVLDLRESLRQLDKADDSQMWHHETALVLMSKGFEYLHQLDGLQRRDIARWSDNPRVQSLLSLAVTVINESAESKRQKRHHELVSAQVAALSAADVADQSRKVAAQSPAWQSGGPRDQIAALRHMDEESRLLVLEARAAELKTQFYTGERLTATSPSEGLKVLHKVLADLDVLSAGEWRSLAVLKYVDEDVIENAAFLRAIDSDEDA
ncbi:YRB2 [Symbiodinium necroappetens]|uniref:YRB2 protein n=1 Tax=Symbiodinium necroappetens TaxID=1628268 RepID=A0A812WF20_9DINO|nr:YRB2 [Symbiodinium necroappetens]